MNFFLDKILSTDSKKYKCVNNCPSKGFVLVDRECKTCPQNCEGCTNKMVCNLCAGNRFLEEVKGECIESNKCSKGKFLKYLNILLYYIYF